MNPQLPAVSPFAAVGKIQLLQTYHAEFQGWTYRGGSNELRTSSVCVDCLESFLSAGASGFFVFPAPLSSFVVVTWMGLSYFTRELWAGGTGVLFELILTSRHESCTLPHRHKTGAQPLSGKSESALVKARMFDIIRDTVRRSTEPYSLYRWASPFR